MNLSWRFILLTALSFSIGWGVRGQFGHEYGAALAGALGGMTIALLSGRADWRSRIPFFAALGAIGWGFGGGMSYMKTVAYAHSSDNATVLYGFACIFVLGFIWAAPGGLAYGLSAELERAELTKLYLPLCAVLAAWYVEDATRPLYRGIFYGPLREYAGAGLNSLVAATAVLLVGAVRRSTWGYGSRLILFMAAGWWAAHLFFIKLLHLDMNPPRGDSWAGCLGLTVGALIFCWRNRLPGVAFTTLGTGFLGGIGFALGTVVKLTVMSSGFDTNWHSVMEQTQGFFFGVAIAITIRMLAARSPALPEEPRSRPWTEVFSVVFVLCVLNYLNFRRSPGEWVKEVPKLTPQLYGIPVVAGLLPVRGFIGWFDVVYIAMAVAMVLILVLHLKRRVPFIPETWLGKGQLFYLVFLWSTVIINFADVLPRFEPNRLVTEWFMTLNAVFCTVLVVYACMQSRPLEPGTRSYASAMNAVVLAGVLGVVAVSFAGLGIKLLLYPEQGAHGASQNQIRFGPNNTNTIK